MTQSSLANCGVTPPEMTDLPSFSFPREMVEIWPREVLDGLRLLADTLAPHEEIARELSTEDPKAVLEYLKGVGVFKDLSFLNDLVEEILAKATQINMDAIQKRPASQRTLNAWDRRISNERPLFASLQAEVGMIATIAGIMELKRDHAVKIRGGIVSAFAFEQALARAYIGQVDKGKKRIDGAAARKENQKSRDMFVELFKWAFHLRALSMQVSRPPQEDQGASFTREDFIKLLRTEAFADGQYHSLATQDHPLVSRVVIESPKSRALLELVRVFFIMRAPLQELDPSMKVGSREQNVLAASISRVSGDLCVLPSGYTPLQPVFEAYGAGDYGQELQTLAMQALMQGVLSGALRTFDERDEEDVAEGEEELVEAITTVRAEVTENGGPELPPREESSAESRKPQKAHFGDLSRVLRTFKAMNCSVERKGRVFKVRNGEGVLVVFPVGADGFSDLHGFTCRAFSQLGLTGPRFRGAYAEQ